MELKHLTFHLLILFSFIIYTNASSPECIYNLYVQTGLYPQAGTRSNITIFLSDEANVELPITNLAKWGLMSSGSKYFGPGQLDLFAGKGPCLHGTACRIIIILDGFDNWYCDFIEVSSVGLGTVCTKKYFAVRKWIDVNQGSAVILQDECSSSDAVSD